ncbi:hemin uptake protein HemP [Marinospirillum celere]|nr:hemin uptake protein HemP [Marinospirillum celere]
MSVQNSHGQSLDSELKSSARKSSPKNTLQSHELFGDLRQLQIEHEGELYTLRITSKGKLILTK